MEKRLKMTDEQYELLRTSNMLEDALGVVISGAILKAAEEMAKNKLGFWDTVEKIAGRPVKKVDWVTREIVLKDEDE